MHNIILDAHFDVLLDVLHFRSMGEEKVLERNYLPVLKAAGVNMLVCSIFIRDKFLPECALRNALDQISALNEDLYESSECFALCRNTREALNAVGRGKIAIFLSLEGAEPIGNDILLLRIFYELGVRLLGVTWSRRNYAGDGSSFKSVDAPRTAGGLTKFGRDLINKAHELGMLVDVSHLNDPGFDDVAEIIKTPFIASHSNSRAVCDVARNLTDEQIRIVAKAGGVIGINAYAPFCSERFEARTPERLLKHLANIVDIAGYEHVGLGLDLCDCVLSLRNGGDMPADRDLFANHFEAYENFIVPIKNKFPAEIADAILGGNFLRVFERVIG